MAFEKLSGKASGRTPEQQAARDARKAAKRAAEAEAVAVASCDVKEDDTQVKEEGEAEAESSTAATRKRKHNTDIEELEVDLEAPTPMNKKEARLAKKKKAKGGDGDEGEGAGEEEKKEKKEKPVPVEKRNSIWIGNLSFRTSGDRIKEFLENGVKELGGDEGSVTRVNLPKEKNKGEFGPSKGFAFVDFSSPENQKLAVDLSERLLEGRKLLIKLGNDHTANPEARTPKPVKPKGLEKQPHGESATLFVGNLPFDATEQGLRDMIEASAMPKGEAKSEAEDESESDDKDSDDEDKEATTKKSNPAQTPATNRGGKNSGLRKVRLGAFEDTGRCKGFAFLDFLSPGEATAALINKGNRFYLNRKLILQYASEDATKRSGTGRALGTGAGTGAGGPRATDDSRPRRGPPPHLANGNGREEQKDTRGKKWEAAGRQAPGAALAAAKREKVGIVEGTGSKITFD